MTINNKTLRGSLRGQQKLGKLQVSDHYELYEDVGSDGRCLVVTEFLVRN